METPQDIAAVEHGDVWLISGDTAAIESFLAEASGSVVSAGGALSASAARRVSEACGIAAQVQENSGRWVRLTEESAARLRDLASTNRPKNGLMGGVIRSQKGRIDRHVRFIMPKAGSVNPFVLSSVATLAASYAAQAAAEEMQETLRGIEEKIDALSEDRRTELVGGTRGVTAVIFEAFTLYQRTGELASASWDKVQSLHPELLSTWHRGIERIRTEAARAAEARVTDRDDIVDGLAKDMLPLWLPVLAQCLISLSRFRVLEQVRVESTDPALAEGHRALVLERNHEMLEELQTMLSEVLRLTAAAIDVPDRLRIAHPLQVDRLHSAASSVQQQVRAFGSRVNWFEDQLGSWENKGWASSIRDLALSGSEAVRGAAAKSLETVRAVELPTDAVKAAASRSLDSIRKIGQPRNPLKGLEALRPKALDGGPGGTEGGGTAEDEEI
jgi:hypothetical protein